MMPITRVPADKRTHDESSQEEAREGGGKWKGGEEGGKEGGKDKRRREGGGRLDGRSSTKERWCSPASRQGRQKWFDVSKCRRFLMRRWGASLESRKAHLLALEYRL